MGYTHGSATKERLLELLAEGLTEHQMGQALGVSERSINRAMIRHGLREKKDLHHIAPEEEQRIAILNSEGMLPSWIADDLGRDNKAILKRTGAQPERNAEWRAIWQQIRRNPELLELHRQFAPRPKGERNVAA